MRQGHREAKGDGEMQAGGSLGVSGTVQGEQTNLGLVSVNDFSAVGHGGCPVTSGNVGAKQERGWSRCCALSSGLVSLHMKGFGWPWEELQDARASETRPYHPCTMLGHGSNSFVSFFPQRLGLTMVSVARLALNSWAEILGPKFLLQPPEELGPQVPSTACGSNSADAESSAAASGSGPGSATSCAPILLWDMALSPGSGSSW